MLPLVALLAAWAVALVINVVPALMPPTWSVLAVFHLLGGPPLLLLTVGGAAASALGRIGLTLLCRRFRGWLPAQDRRNADALSAFLRRHQRWRDSVRVWLLPGAVPQQSAVYRGRGRADAAGTDRDCLLRQPRDRRQLLGLDCGPCTQERGWPVRAATHELAVDRDSGGGARRRCTALSPALGKLAWPGTRTIR